MITPEKIAELRGKAAGWQTVDEILNALEEARADKERTLKQRERLAYDLKQLMIHIEITKPLGFGGRVDAIAEFIENEMITRSAKEGTQG